MSDSNEDLLDRIANLIWAAGYESYAVDNVITISKPTETFKMEFTVSAIGDEVPEDVADEFITIYKKEVAAAKLPPVKKKRNKKNKGDSND